MALPIQALMPAPWKLSVLNYHLPHLKQEAWYIKNKVTRGFKSVRCRHQFTDKAESACSSYAVRAFTTIPKAGEYKITR